MLLINNTEYAKEYSLFKIKLVESIENNNIDYISTIESIVTILTKYNGEDLSIKNMFIDLLNVINTNTSIPIDISTDKSKMLCEFMLQLISNDTILNVIDISTIQQYIQSLINWQYVNKRLSTYTSNIDKIKNILVKLSEIHGYNINIIQTEIDILLNDGYMKNKDRISELQEELAKLC